jgi:hypothetical protein
MRLLVCGCTTSVAGWRAKRPDRLGVLLTPQKTNSLPEEGVPFAADNGCFGGLDAPAWLKFLAKLAAAPAKPMWVCCPDVVADMHATWRQYDTWAPVLRSLGLPVALVLQDGLEQFKHRARLPSTWGEVDAVFLGGSTAWKESEHAEGFCRQAKDRGKLVHVGRVNTERRIRMIAGWDCVDTIDGSRWSKWGGEIGLAVKWIDQALADRARQPSLFAEGD